MSAPTTSGCSDCILEIHWTFPPTTGGVESHISDLAAAMARRGYRVVVMTGEMNPVRCDQYPVISTPLLNLEAIKTGSPARKEFAAQFEELLARVICDNRVTIIHGHNLHHFHSAPAQAIETVRRKFGLSVFHTFHETWPDLLCEKPVYRLWDGNYAVSRHVQEQCRVALGFQPALHALGVDVDIFKSSTECFTSKLPPVIFHPARLLPWKGVDLSIRALRSLLDRGNRATLVITDTQRIADWDNELALYRERIIRLIAELNLTPYVRFERATYADMPRLYEKADIVVYPTIGEEPYGLVPIEAMSCARPIVASNSGGIPETVIDGITGFLVPRGDAIALADRLAELISNPHVARRLGAAGRRRATNDFGLQSYVSVFFGTLCQAKCRPAVGELNPCLPLFTTTRQSPHPAHATSTDTSSPPAAPA